METIQRHTRRGAARLRGEDVVAIATSRAAYLRGLLEGRNTGATAGLAAVSTPRQWPSRPTSSSPFSAAGFMSGACVAPANSTYVGSDTGEESEAVSRLHVRSGDVAVAITFERAYPQRERTHHGPDTRRISVTAGFAAVLSSGRLTLRARQQSLTREVWC